MRKKRVLIGAIFATACLLSGAGFEMMGKSLVTANANATKKTISDVSFVMKKGASVRYASSSDNSGIRFSVNLSAADYLGLEANEGDAYTSVSYGMVMMPYTYLDKYGDLTVANLFGSNAKYDWAQWNGSEWVYSGDNTTKKRIICLSYGEMEVDKDDANYYVFSGSMSGIKDANLARDFVGRGYIKVVKANGDEEYMMADYTDNNIQNNVRSIVEVAEKAYADENVTDQDKLDALSDYYINATNVRYVKFYDGETLIDTHQTMKNYAFDGEVTLGDGFSYWEDENGDAVAVDSSYEIVGTTKLYAVFESDEAKLQTATSAVESFLAMSVTTTTLNAAKAQYQAVQTAIDALDARTYNSYVTEAILAGINAKVAEINNVLENSPELYESFSGVLYTGQSMLSGMSATDASGNKPKYKQASTVFTGGVHFDCSDGTVADWTVAMPKMNFSAYQTVSLSFKGAKGWQTFGFVNGSRLADSGDNGVFVGTITFTNNYNGTVTCTISTTSPTEKSISYTITDSAVINGTKAFTFFWNQGAQYRGMHFSEITATSLYNIWAVPSSEVITSQVSVKCPQGVATALNLPLVNYSLYDEVTFTWSVTGWTQTGHKSDLWYYNSGSALGGTVTIVNNGDGTLKMTMTETKVGQGSHSKTISDSAIVNGQAALTLNANSLVNTQTLTASAMTATVSASGRETIAMQAGKTAKAVSAVLYTGQSLYDNISVTNASGGKPFAKAVTTVIPDGVKFDCSGTGATDWTVYLPKINYLAYETVSLGFQGTSTWQTFGFVSGGRVADGGGSALSGTITFTNNGNGTVTCVISEAVKGNISYTITDGAVLNGDKAFTLFWNQGATYRQMTFGPISATFVPEVEAVDELTREEKDISVGTPYVSISQKTYAENITMKCNNDQTLPLTLPVIDYSIYEKVTFTWSAMDWTMFGQGADLWFSALGGGDTGGTGEIVYTGNGSILLTLTDTVVLKKTHAKTIEDSNIANGETALQLHGHGYADGRTFTVTNVTAYNGKAPVSTSPCEYVLKDFSYSAYETTAVDVDDADRYLLVNYRDGNQGLTLETQSRNAADTTENLYAISLPWIDYSKYQYVTTSITTSNGKAIGFKESDMLSLKQYYDSASNSYPVYPTELKLTYMNNALVVTLKHQDTQRTTIITDQDVIYGKKGFTFYVVGVQYTGYTLHNMMAAGRYSTKFATPDMELDLGEESGDTGYSEYRIAWYANDEWTHDYYNYEFAATELASFLSRWTGMQYQTVRMYDGAAVQPDSKYIVLGGSLAQEAGMTLDGVTKSQGYKIVQDYTNLYIYSETSEGTLAGVYGFLKEQADVTFYTDEVFTENVTENSATVGAGTSLTFNPSFNGAQAGYAEVQHSEAYQRRMGLYADWYVTSGAAMYGAATTWDANKRTGTHNMMQVFPYDMYGSTYSDWYFKDEGGNWQLDFSANNTHLQTMKDMFVASAKVAIANQPQIEYFEFAQADTLYSLDVAGYLSFMNYAAEQLDAWLVETNPNRTIALVMYAYNGTRIAPSSGSIYNGDNVYVTVCFAPVGMRYTDKVDASDSYHKNTSTNKWDKTATTYEALLSWTNLTGFDASRNLIYWMYGTDFYNYMMPMDTITNLQYNYQKLNETGTDMVKYQFQTKAIDNVGSNWQRLKTYLSSELTKDVNADVATLQANFMNAMYGAGATYMQQLLSAQQAYCTYDNFNSKDGMFKSDYTELYFGVINGSAKLMSSTYFSESTLTTWMGYIDNAKAAVNADTKLTDVEKAAYIERIEVEALSIRYMLIKLHNVKKYDASLSAWEAHAASLGCVAVSEG